MGKKRKWTSLSEDVSDIKRVSEIILARFCYQVMLFYSVINLSSSDNIDIKYNGVYM